MCELLGMNFNHPVYIGFSFAGLMSRSGWNKDGWGLGLYPDEKAAAVYKEAIAGQHSLVALFIAKYRCLRSATFLAHIRQASRGQIAFSNSHPFNHHYQALEFLFIHNGTLDKKQFPVQKNFHPIGETDSEQVFCFLLSKMAGLRIYPVRKGEYIGYDEQQINAIYQILLDINDHGSMCCIFSDGRSLFAYRDKNGARELHFTEKTHEHSTHRLGDGEIKVTIHPDNEEHGNGLIFASEPLSAGEWQSFKPGQLIVTQHGQVIANLTK